MALLGGAGALFGPALGAIPLVLLFEVLTANFPNAFSDPARRHLHPHRLLRAARRDRPAATTGGPARAAAGCRRAGVVREPTPAPGRRRPAQSPSAACAPSTTSRFRVEPGEIVGLIGPNGSGKTTVLNLISGALRPDAGQHPLPRPIHRGRRAPPDRDGLGIARTFQLVRVLPSMSLRENISPSLAFRALPATGRRRAPRPSALLGARRPRSIARRCAPAELTYIDQKRLELARALALEPKLLLLDEWLAGLNPTELEEGIALDPVAAPRRRQHRHGRARDGCDPRALRPLRRHERRPRDRRRRAAPCAAPSPRSCAPIWERPMLEIVRPLRQLRQAPGACPTSPCRSAAARSSPCSAPTAPARRRC